MCMYVEQTPSQPNLLGGQKITIPGPVFPIYADKVPPHHLPLSPQAISRSDVTLPLSQMPSVWFLICPFHFNRPNHRHHLRSKLLFFLKPIFVQLPPDCLKYTPIHLHTYYVYFLVLFFAPLRLCVRSFNLN
jgi:hypothetical protein